MYKRLALSLPFSLGACVGGSAPEEPPRRQPNDRNRENRTNNIDQSQRPELRRKQQSNQKKPAVRAQKYFTNSHRTYSCAHCRAHLADHDDVISKLFQGNHGRAFLFNKVVNVGYKQAVQRQLLTGLHVVADIYCDNCQTTLGWHYEQAFVPSQKYKEGKYIIELAHMLKENDWDPNSTNSYQLIREDNEKKKLEGRFDPTPKTRARPIRWNPAPCTSDMLEYVRPWVFTRRNILRRNYYTTNLANRDSVLLSERLMMNDRRDYSIPYELDQDYQLPPEPEDRYQLDETNQQEDRQDQYDAAYPLPSSSNAQDIEMRTFESACNNDNGEVQSKINGDSNVTTESPRTSKVESSQNDKIDAEVSLVGSYVERQLVEPIGSGI